MGKMKKVTKRIEKYVWVLIVIPLVVTIIPYGIIWTFWPPLHTREILKDVRFWSLAWIGASGSLSWLKIKAYELGFLRNKKNETAVDLFLSVLVYPAYGILVLYYVPVLLILLVVAHFATKEKVTGWERRAIITLFIMGVVFTFTIAWFFVSRGQLPLGLVVVLLYLTILLILIVLAFTSNNQRISTAKRIIDGAIYILSLGALFVCGMLVEVTGKIVEWVFMIVSNHEGAFEYIAGLWTRLLKWRPSKILAGDNLGDFPIVGDFIALKTITVKGRRRTKEYKGFWGKVIKYLIKILKIIVFVIIFLLSGKKKWKKGNAPVNNVALLREVPRCIEKKILVWVPPKGRERLSDNGELKRIEPLNLKDVDVVQPTLCLGPLAYKPANKKEKSGKKWYQQQFWVSPRKIRVHHLDPVRRLPNETDEQYSLRIWVIMTIAKKRILEEIFKEELYAQFRLSIVVARITQPFKKLRKASNIRGFVYLYREKCIL